MFSGENHPSSRRMSSETEAYNPNNSMNHNQITFPPNIAVNSIDSERKSLFTSNETLKKFPIDITPADEIISLPASPTKKPKARSKKKTIREQTYLDSDSLQKMQDMINMPTIKGLSVILEGMSKETRLKKAARHLEDALFYRKVRHDIEMMNNKFFKYVYFLQTNPSWQTFLYILSWVYLLLTILEPSHQKDSNFFERNGNFSPLVGLETTILIFFGFELFLECYHLKFDYRRSTKEKYIMNFKLSSKFLVFWIFLIDYMIFYTDPEHDSFRFSRFFRPVCLALYDMRVRSTIRILLNSSIQMLEVIVFFAVVGFLYAMIGVAILGKHGTSTSEVGHGFDDFGSGINNMYMLISRDNYPAIVEPYLKISYWYLLYFIPFIIINILVLLPIPIAVMFEAYKENRAKVFLQSKIKQSEALFVCYFTIDMDMTMSLSKNDFKDLLDITFKKKLSTQQIFEIFDSLDEESKGYLTLEEFFEIDILLKANKNFLNKKSIELKTWNIIREFCGKKLRANAIVESYTFNILIVIVIFSNFGISFAVLPPDHAQSITNAIYYLTIPTWIEIFLNIIIEGITFILKDPWMQFQICINLLTLVANPIFACISIIRLLEAKRVERLFKNVHFRSRTLQKIAKTFKLGRKKIQEFKQLTINVVECFNLGLEFVVMLFWITYVYALVGMEIFQQGEKMTDTTISYPKDYTNFSSIQEAFLALLHVLNGARWTDLQNSYSEKFGFSKSAVFFDSYHILANFLILSLLTGLIIEIFTFAKNELTEEFKRRAAEELEKEAQNPLNLIKGKSPISQEGNKSTPSKMQPRIVIAQAKKIDIESEVQTILNQIYENDLNSKFEKMNTLNTKFKKLLTDQRENDYGMIKTELKETIEDNLKFTQQTSSKEQVSEADKRYPERLNKKLNINRSSNKLNPKNGDVDNPQKGSNEFILTSRFTVGDESPRELAKKKREKNSRKQSSLIPGLKFGQAIKGQASILKEYFVKEKMFYEKKFVLIDATYSFGNQYDLLFSTKKKRNKNYEQMYLKIEYKNLIDGIAPLVQDKSVKKFEVIASAEEKIIREAIIKKGTQGKEVKCIEDEYIREIYGSYFLNDTTKGGKIENILQAFQIENHCILRLSRLMRQKFTAINFLNIIESIEKSITINLLDRGGISKFIFRDQNKKWFFFKRSMNDPLIEYISNGPWYYYDQVFKQDYRVYEANRIFSKQEEDSLVVSKLHKSFQNIADENFYINMNDLDSMYNKFNFHAIPMSCDQTKITIQKNSSSSGLSNNFDDVNITHCMFVSLSSNLDIKESKKSKLKEAPLRKKSTFSNKKRNRSSENLSINNIENNTEAARNRSFDRLDDNMNEKPKGCLPKEEYVEMLRDFCEVFSSNRETFFTNITSVYLDALNKEKLFST